MNKKKEMRLLLLIFILIMTRHFGIRIKSKEKIKYKNIHLLIFKILEAGRFLLRVWIVCRQADYLYVKNQAIGKGIW